MTEYELASLFNELLTTLLSVMETFMAVLFAMLVAAYFAAPKLTRTMSATLIGLFTLFSAVVIFFAVAQSRRVAGAGVRLDGMASQIDSNVTWFYFVPAAAPIIPLAVATVLIAAYVATLIFFLHARRGGRVA